MCGSEDVRYTAEHVLHDSLHINVALHTKKDGYYRSLTVLVVEEYVYVKWRERWQFIY